MSKVFNVEVITFQKLSTIENAWNTADYKAILGLVDIDEGELNGLTDAEIKEMAMMSLNELEPHESAKHLLDLVFQDQLTEGKRDQISHQMVEQSLWEEYSDPSYHFQFFKIYGFKNNRFL